MSKPIYASDLYKDDKAILEAIAQLEDLGAVHEREMKRIERNAKRLAEQNKKLNTSTVQGRDEIKKTAAEADKLAKAYASLEEAQSAVGKELAAVREEKRKVNQLNKLEIKQNNSLEGSYDNLSAQYSILKIRINAMGEATEEAREEKRKMEAQAKGLYERMKQLQEATGKHTLSVGDYGKAFRDIGGPIQSAVDAIGDFGSAMKALLSNPFVAAISLIAGALIGLFRAFKQSEQGAVFMAQASGVLQSIWGNVIQVANNLLGGLNRLFTEPQQAIKDFGQSIVDGVINRLKGVRALAVSLGAVFKALWNRDLSALKEAAEGVGRAGIQMISGLDAEAQKEFAASVRETTKEVIAEADAFAKLEVAKIRVKQQNREIAKSVEDLTTKEQEYRAVADNTTRSFKERNEANEEARSIAEKRAAAEIQLARNNLSLINQEIGLRRANKESIEALLDSQLSAYQQLRAAERELTLTRLDNQRTREELRQDELERDLDILIDGFDNQKTINERIIADDRRTFEERAKKLEETQALADRSFEKQIETIQKFTNVQVDANSLISESDAVVLNEKIRSLGLSEIIEGRLLEIVRDRKSAVSELADAERDLNEERAKSSQEALNAQRAAAMAVLEQDLELSESQFELQKSTEAEKTRFALQQEIFRYQRLLKINEEFQGDLSDAQIRTYKNRIAKAQSEIESISVPQDGLLGSLGLDLSDGQKEVLNESLQFAKAQLNEWVQARKAAADAAVAESEREVDSARERLRIELEAARAGEANQVERARSELALAEKQQKDALRLQEKAARDQRAIETAQQASSLITASAKIWAQVGFPAALPALAIMWGSFAASKIRAFRDTKNYREGGFERLEGGSHASGKDIPLFTGKDGVERRAEGGEGMMIVSKRAMGKYGGLMPMIEQALNRGYFEEVFNYSPTPEVSYSMGVNTGIMEGELRKMNKRAEGRPVRDVLPDGSILETVGNVTRLIRTR